MNKLVMLALLAIAADAMAGEQPQQPPRPPAPPGPPAGLLAIAGLEKTSAAFRAALVALAARLGIDPNHLAAAISFESDFDPAALNPESGAIGLIQFTGAALRPLGMTVQQWKAAPLADRQAAHARFAKLTDLEQLPFVERDFREAAPGRDLSRLVDVYLAIFAPAHIGQPDSAPVYSAPSRNYRQNRHLDQDHDGVITVADATAHVRAIYAAGLKRGPLQPPQPPGPVVPPPGGGTGPTPGASLLQSEVTPPMTAWAMDVLHSSLPIGSTTGPRTFGSMQVIARAELHPPQPAVPHPHRGVGLYHVPGVKPAGGDKPPHVPGSTADVYRSQQLILHPSGWVALPGGRGEITAFPFLDENGLLGHVSAASGAQLLGAMGLQLPSAADYLALHADPTALHIEPVTLPTVPMLIADGVPKPWLNPQTGKDEPPMAAYRAARMASRAWCELHDGAVMARLAAAGWDGKRRVPNAGKHWTNDGGIIGWWLKGGGQIQGFSHKHEPGEVGHVPPLGQEVDYSTTVHGRRAAV